MKLEDIQLPKKELINAKDFDKEKWRKENPMDYLKAARILTMSKEPAVTDEIFKTIFQIAQLHIPDTLYKYYSLTDNTEKNEKKFNTLLQKKVFLSEVKDFNDPFDCKAFYYNSDVLSKHDRLKHCNGRVIDDFSSMQRVASLTECGVQSMPMWAHYANNHEGFCVAYDMNDCYNHTMKSCTFPVQYTDQRVDITSVMDSFVSAALHELEVQQLAGNKTIVIDDLSVIYIPILLCNIKHNSWSYEKEYRCPTAANAEGIPFIDAKAKEIYIGIRCNDENRKRLQVIGKTLEIPVHEMGFDEISAEYRLCVQ